MTCPSFHRVPRVVRPSIAAALTCSLVACTGPTDAGEPDAGPPAPERGGEPLQTDALTYFAEPQTTVSPTSVSTVYRFRVVARYTNRTGAVVYLPRCNKEPRVPLYRLRVVADTADRDESSAYNQWWRGTVTCVRLGEEFAVPAGATRVDTLAMEGPRWSTFTGIIGALDGRVRLVYEPQGCRGDRACTLPADQGTSNAFDVKLRR